MRLVLASASPRRAELLRAAGFSFTITAVDVDEEPRVSEPPRDYVERLALEKALAAAGRAVDSVVLGADTTVVVRGEILGKPENAAECARMMRLLSGRTHQVLTGVAVVHNEQALTAVESTSVHVARLSDDEIAWYVRSREPYDKAGGYAVQGLASRFIDRIEGSYTNVVGLPVSVVYRLLRQSGCDILGM